MKQAIKNQETGVDIMAECFAKFNGQELAIVPLNTITRLVQNMNSAPYERIRGQFINLIRDCDNMEQMMFELQNEIDFHTSIKEIDNYNLSNKKEEEEESVNPNAGMIEL